MVVRGLHSNSTPPTKTMTATSVAMAASLRGAPNPPCRGEVDDEGDCGGLSSFDSDEGKRPWAAVATAASAAFLGGQTRPLRALTEGA